MTINDYIIELSKYRINKAIENIEAANVLFESKLYSESLNRSYYAIFHSLRALLAYNEFDSKKHSGIISYFNQNYVKNNKFSKEYSIILNEAFIIRNRSDYDDFYLASKDEAKEQIRKAILFLNGIRDYIDTNVLDNNWI